ncbi:hypothetical protein VE00_08539 [Pseudogymnoascus sp. WSF 3629]|nr:hypothetical protein VE00_08539 [Pseudogymnoascus sp. WSF 3629]
MAQVVKVTSPFDGLEAVFQKAVEDGTLPGVVVAARSRDEMFSYDRAFGKDACSPSGQQLRIDSSMAIASMTKLMTSIAVLHLAERQVIGLDEDVTKYIPDLARQGILVGWDAEGRPLVLKRHNQITLRHLLTHSSGVGYDMSNSDLAKYTAYCGRKINCGSTVSERFDYPLIFEPGLGWEYGAGIDWAGQVIERLTGQTLETYMRENISEPLGIKGMTFWPERDVRTDSTRMQMSIRDPDSGHAVPFQKPFLTEGVGECFGGQGVYTNMEDFIKVLHSLLLDDGKLLNKQSTVSLFRSHISKASKDALNSFLNSCGSNPAFIGVFNNQDEYDWGLGGLLALHDQPSGRTKGTLLWSGKPNLFWVSNLLVP